MRVYPRLVVRCMPPTRTFTEHCQAEPIWILDVAAADVLPSELRGHPDALFVMAFGPAPRVLWDWLLALIAEQPRPADGAVLCLTGPGWNTPNPIGMMLGGKWVPLDVGNCTVT